MSLDSDLIRALATAQQGAPIRMGHPVRTISLPDLGKDGYGCRPVFDAAVALCTGQAIDMQCGGVHGLTWRVEWHDRFNPKRARYAGVLDPFQRLFTTTATGAHALQGFALASLGFAWATPSSGMQGEWASLLATFGATGERAFTTAYFEALRDTVLEALRIRELGATGDMPLGAHGFPIWRCATVEDVLDLPALDTEPGTLATARIRYGQAPIAKIMEELGLFTATSVAWRRDVHQWSTAGFVRTHSSDLLQALDAGQHTVICGPAGAGKSHGIREVFARLAEREILAVSLPEIPLAMYNSSDRLFGSCGPDGTWVDGPLRAAMVSGKGEMVHLSCVGEPSAEVVTLLGVAIRQRSLPAGLVPGAPATEVGADFRVVLEMTVPEPTSLERGNGSSALPAASALHGIASLAWITFVPPTGWEAEQLLFGSGESRNPALLYLVRYIVEEVDMAVASDELPRRISLAELMSWVRMARGTMLHSAASDVTEMLESAARALRCAARNAVSMG